MQRSSRLFPVLLALWLHFLGPLAWTPTPALAWSGGGHHVIGLIAAERLDPRAGAEVDRLLGQLAPLEPRSHSIPGASIWLDQLRHGGLRTFDDWHWVNLPYEPEGGGLAPAEPPGKLLEITRQAIDVLEDPDSPSFSRAFMLRVLLHTVGDAHQPLHCVARYTPEEPEGDRGGNRFDVVDPGNRWRNLHFLWDFGLGLLPQVHGPLESETAGALAQEIGGEELSSRLAERAEILDPRIWCEEGRDLAVRVVYAGIEEGSDPTEAYVGRGRDVVRRQLRLAGERLARILNRALVPGDPGQDSDR